MFSIRGLLNGVLSNEINLVFDNCAGQNKNRMVYRMLFFMVKLGVCKTARAIFLVKGHTKNGCDRMFKLSHEILQEGELLHSNRVCFLTLSTGSLRSRSLQWCHLNSRIGTSCWLDI
jgi:hypothetical protein